MASSSNSSGTLAPGTPIASGTGGGYIPYNPNSAGGGGKEVPGSGYIPPSNSYVQYVAPTIDTSAGGGFQTITGEQQIVTPSGQVISQNPLALLQARGYTQSQAQYLVNANLGQMPNEFGLQQYDRGLKLLNDAAQKDLKDRQDRVISGQATSSYSGFTEETINPTSIAQDKINQELAQQPNASYETTKVEYYTKVIDTFDGIPVLEYRVKEGNVDRLATEEEKNFMISARGYEPIPEPTIIDKISNVISEPFTVVGESIKNAFTFDTIENYGKVFNALITEDAQKLGNIIEKNTGFSENTIINWGRYLQSNKFLNPIPSDKTVPDVYKLIDFNTLAGIEAGAYKRLRYEPISLVKPIAYGIATEGIILAAKGVLNMGKETIRISGMLRDSNGWQKFVAKDSGKFAGKVANVGFIGVAAAKTGYDVYSAQSREAQGEALFNDIVDFYSFGLGAKYTQKFVKEPIVTKEIPAKTTRTVIEKGFSVLKEGDIIAQFSKYKQTTIQEPPQQEITTRFRQLMGIEPIKELKPGKPTISSVEVPFYTEVGKPFFVVEKTPRTTKISLISGVGEPIDILGKYPNLPPIEKALLEVSSGQGVLPKTTREKLSEGLLSKTEKELKATLKEMGFQFEVYKKISPQQEKIVPELFPKESQFIIGDVDRRVLFSGKEFPKNAAEFYAGRVPYAKSITRARYITELREVPTKESSPIESFATKTTFKETTKPNARATGQFPMMEGISIRLKALQERIVNLDKIEFKPVDLKANTDQINKQITEQLKRVESAPLKQHPIYLPKLQELPSPISKMKADTSPTARSTRMSIESIQSQALQPVVKEVTSVIRPEDISKSINIQVDFTKENTREMNKELERQLNRDLTKEMTRELDKQLNKDLTKEITKEMTKELSKEMTRELQKENQKQLQRELMKEIQKTVLFPPIVTINRTKTPTTGLPTLRQYPTGQKAGKKESAGYWVYGKIIRTNKFQKINDTPVTHDRALDIGSFYVTQNVSRSYKVEKANQKAQEDNFFQVPYGYYNSVKNQLRNYKIKNRQPYAFGEQFIQKSPYLLSSESEKRQIQSFRKQVSQMSKGF